MTLFRHLHYLIHTCYLQNLSSSLTCHSHIQVYTWRDIDELWRVITLITPDTAALWLSPRDGEGTRQFCLGSLDRHFNSAFWSFYDIAQFCRISSMGFNATGPRFDAPVLRRRFDAPVLLSPPCDCPTSGGDWAFLGFDMVPRMVVPSQVWDLMRQDLGPMRQRISRLTFNATGTRSNATETVALFRYRLQCDSNFANS